jgi:REP element-mobilizing transposase RayT
MPQSLANILIHIVFSTKNRVPLITPAIESELYPYLGSIFHGCKSPSLAIGGTADHVHVLCSLHRSMDVATLLEQIKSDSSRWIKTKGPQFADFYWQSGYGAFSIGQSGVGALKAYIANQKEHHRSVTFQEEYRLFLKKYEIEYDERYMWD